MVADNQALGTYVRTRGFYKGGTKSENKGYYLRDGHQGPEPQLVDRGKAWFGKLSDKELQRNEFASLASRIGQNQRGSTPYEVGQTKYLEGDTVGNCGIMACVALYLAIALEHVPVAEALYRTAENPNHTSLGYQLTFGHSWLVLGTAGARYCIDPWAGVCCKEQYFADQFLAQMREWNRIGKRIAVNWLNPVDRARRVWMAPTDEAIAALLAPNATVSDIGANGNFPKKPP